MKLDADFVREFKKTMNGDGSKEYKFALIDEIEQTSAILAHRYEWNAAFAIHGRVLVACCVASTICESPNDYTDTQIEWANDVMRRWTNRCERSVSSAIVRLHPGILIDNANFLMQNTVL